MKIRRFERLALLLILMACLFACKKGEPQNATEEPGATSQEETTDMASTGIIDLLSPTPAEKTEMQPTSEKQSTDAGDDSVPHLIWGYSEIRPISVEAQSVVKKRITDAGIGCIIDFIAIPSEVFEGGHYRTWLEEQKSDNMAPDILTSGTWEHGALDVADFVRDEFLPLNDYLKSDEGCLVQENFSSVEWLRSTMEQTIYSVPKRLKDGTGRDKYLYVKDSYIEDFNEIYDSTYQSLRKVSEKNASGNPVIAFSGVSYDQLEAWMGYWNLFLFTYEIESGRAKDLTKLNETRELLQLIYTDYQTGLLINVGAPSELPENAIAYMSYKRAQDLKGYTEVMLTSDPLPSDFGGTYGIRSDSSKKDLALQVYGVCYSDPKIASILYWGEEDEDGWKKITEDLSSYTSGPLTGFVPVLSEEEKDSLSEYLRDETDLVAKMFRIKGQGMLELNPDYPDFLDNFFENPKDYGTVFDTINAQLEQWAADKSE